MPESVGRTYITHIAEAARTIDVGIGKLSDLAFLVDEVQRQCIHEVGTVGTFEDTQYYPTFALAVVAWRPAHTGDDMSPAQVESCPGIATLPSGKKGVQVAIESIGTGVDGCRHLGGIAVVYTLQSANHRSRQLAIGKSFHPGQRQQSEKSQTHCLHTVIT